MEEYREVELSTGTILRVSTLPVSLLWDTVLMVDGLQELDRPVQRMALKTGAIEELFYDDDAPEIIEWKAENERRAAARMQLYRLLRWQVGVISWKLPGQKRFITTLPKGWQIPANWKPLIEVQGWNKFKGLIEPRHLAYIYYDLCKLTDDGNLVQEALTLTAPLTRSEVDAAKDTFPSSEEG